MRPASLAKPAITDFRARGAKIVELDVVLASEERLVAAFENMDIVISALDWEQIESQVKLIDAAKRAGVKRFVPSEFASTGVPGIMELHDRVSPATVSMN